MHETGTYVKFTPAGAELFAEEAVPMNWSRPFDDPIVLPDGGELRTLLDAGRYVDALPRSMHEREGVANGDGSPAMAVEGREPVRLVHVALLGLAGEQRMRGARRKPAKK